MEMITIPISVAKGIAPYVDGSEQEQTFVRSAMLIYPLIQNLTISHGRAAELLGVHKFDLIDFYCSMGMPYLNQSIEDIEEEMADIHAFEGAEV